MVITPCNQTYQAQILMMGPYKCPMGKVRLMGRNQSHMDYLYYRKCFKNFLFHKLPEKNSETLSQ